MYETVLDFVLNLKSSSLADQVSVLHFLLLQVQVAAKKVQHSILMEVSETQVSVQKVSIQMMLSRQMDFQMPLLEVLEVQFQGHFRLQELVPGPSLPADR